MATGVVLAGQGSRRAVLALPACRAYIRLLCGEESLPHR